MYTLLRPLFFSLDPELAHEIALDVLNTIYPVLPKIKQGKPVKLMGLTFKNSVGLAAGMDKNGDYIDALSRLGFGFIEIGSVTPKAQEGNPKPRLFRVTQYESVINRMGFNNKGVDHLLRQVKQRQSDTVLGINIGKNLTTPVDKALDDYLIGLTKVYDAADYVAINVSSPNTPGLRSLQGEEALESLLSGIQQQAKKLQDQTGSKTPIVLKIAPDLDAQSIAPICDLLVKYQIDGLIASNTTLSREAIASHKHAGQAGGLSGWALQLKSREILSQFQQQLQGEIPIISAGGIDSVEEANKRLEIGAQLIQVYSALIYKGPALIRNLVNNLN